MESAPQSCVFIGKPCDVAGLRNAMKLKPSLAEKVGIVIGIFCAGTPSLQGTIDLLKKMNINPDDLSTLRYRGRGWPGLFTVQLKYVKNKIKTMTYNEAWGFIQAYRPYRCYLCPEATRELVDISCGDAWYRAVKDDDAGYSIVLVRTEKGKQIIRRAIKAGYITIERATPQIPPLPQGGIPGKRGAVWVRVLTMRVVGLPTPKYVGFSLFRNWLAISVFSK